LSDFGRSMLTERARKLVDERANVKMMKAAHLR
jgi:hypothetical protein